MELKDYLHYYLGCRVQATPYGGQQKKQEYGKLIGIGIHDVVNIKFDTWQSIADVSMSCVKPILRRLEDMTEEEATELVRLVVHEDEYLNVLTYRHNHTNDLMVQWGLLTPMERANDVEYYFNATGERSWSAVQFHYLLQQGFDLFGLIPAGIATDAKTVKS